MKFAVLALLGVSVCNAAAPKVIAEGDVCTTNLECVSEVAKQQPKKDA